MPIASRQSDAAVDVVVSAVAAVVVAAAAAVAVALSSSLGTFSSASWGGFCNGRPVSIYIKLLKGVICAEA